MSELLMLSKPVSGDFRISEMMCSEKIDGMRAVFVPETRGLHIKQIPWANRAKDDREYSNLSGLWTRYAKPITCPIHWTQDWPDRYIIDGELRAIDGGWSQTMSICKTLYGFGWETIKFNVFDIVPRFAFYAPRRVNNANYKHTFTAFSVDMSEDVIASARYSLLLKYTGCPNIAVLPQTVFKTFDEYKVYRRSILDAGAEGVILKELRSLYRCKRASWCLKDKPTLDSEATIVGHNPGLGRHLGRLGSYTVKWRGKVFELSGMTDQERETVMPIGTIVTFLYTSLTADGIPREARYLRKY